MSSNLPDLRALMRSNSSAAQSDPSPLPLKFPTSMSVSVPRPKSRWRTRVLVPLTVLLTTGGVLAYAARDVLSPAIEVHVAPTVPKAGSSTAPAAVAPALESAADAPVRKSGPGPVLVQAPGWIEPAPYAINVPALAEGFVQEVLVLEGEHVETGQVVARLIDADAKLQLRLAESAVAQRAADVERAKAALATAETQVIIEQAAVSELQNEIDRKRELVGSGVSAGDFRRMEIRLGGLEAQATAAQQVVEEASAAVRQAESAVVAVMVSRDEAALRLERMEIHAPAAGVVLARLIEPGTHISMNARTSEGGAGAMAGAVLRLYNPEKLQVRVDVPLAEAAKVVVGSRAEITTEAIPDATFEGVVTRAMHEANIQRNTVQFKVSIERPSAVLKPEMLTRVKLYGPAIRESSGETMAASSHASSDGFGLLIPVDALVGASENTASVWLVDASSGSPLACKRDVTTHMSSEDGFVEIVTGLRAGDRVIVEPSAEIRHGSRLKILGERTGSSSNTQSSGGGQ